MVVMANGYDSWIIGILSFIDRYIQLKVSQSDSQIVLILS